MDCKKVINQLLLERNITLSDLAAKLNMQPQSLRNKISRGNYSVNDFQKILDILNCELIARTKDNNKTFS